MSYRSWRNPGAVVLLGVLMAGGLAAQRRRVPRLLRGSRVSADQWTGTLHAVTSGGAETVYVMRRVRR